MAEKVSRKDARTRNYATVVYKDSAPENWQEIISELKIPVFISPYHDKDVNPTGEPKKPHWHVLFLFDGKKSVSQVEEIINKFGGVGVEIVESSRGYARYLCHLDNPEKVQYKVNDVKSFGGADYVSVIGRMVDKNQACKEMIEFIEENDIVCFADLVKECMFSKSEWFDALVNSCSYFIKEYIKSRTWKLYKYSEDSKEGGA